MSWNITRRFGEGRGPGRDVPQPLIGLLLQLPVEGWTQERRDVFIEAFGTVLDYCVPIAVSLGEADK